METEKEIIDELSKITGLVQRFNNNNNRFMIDLHVNKKESISRLSLDQIMRRICSETKLTPEYLCMKSREPAIVVPRQLCHYMAAMRTKHSLAEIGFYFGGKDHATVLNSKNKIKNRIDTDKEFRDKWIPILNG